VSPKADDHFFRFQMFECSYPQFVDFNERLSISFHFPCFIIFNMFVLICFLSLSLYLYKYLYIYIYIVYPFVWTATQSKQQEQYIYIYIYICVYIYLYSNKINLNKIKGSAFGDRTVSIPLAIRTSIHA